MDRFRRLTHSYVIEGQDKDARYEFVQNFIMKLECQDESEDRRPCGNCPACRQILAGTSMDVFHMEKSLKSGYSAQKDIGPFIDRLAMGSYGRYTIGVIDDADELSEIAQNKLLKTLEEPRENVVIILGTSNRDNMLSTVLSRCQVVRCLGGNLEGTVHPEDVQAKYFYKYRSNIDKKLGSLENAIALLGAMEEEYRAKMIKGEDLDRSIKAIEYIEKTRRDILKGMSYSAALKKLYLALS